MLQLARVLEEPLGNSVADHTGLTGNFDFDVQWARVARPGVEPGDVSVEDRAAIFTALREQLGLKLEPTREVTEVIVVDSVQRPSAD